MGKIYSNNQKPAQKLGLTQKMQNEKEQSYEPKADWLKTNMVRNLRFLLLITGSFFLFVFGHPEKGKTPKGLPIKKQGMILNLAADAVVLRADWGTKLNQTTTEAELKASPEFYNLLAEHIRKLSREQALTSLYGFVDKYAKTQVTCLFFNINYHRVCFDSKVMDSYWNLPDPEHQLTHWPRCLWMLQQKGLDTYQLLIDRSRQKGISPWISIRMSDHHYFDDSTKINGFWMKHPELRTSERGAYNYAKKEVRDYFKAFILEVLEKYDVDGIELDWMRSPSIFKREDILQGTELINQFMKDIRLMTEQKSKERGHPIKIAARVPSFPNIGKSYGLDGIAWVKNATVDILIPTNWASTNFDIPLELWRSEIGSGHDYILAPGADAIGNKSFNINRYKSMFSNVETLRGFSASAYSRGADAIYYFNSFIPVYSRKIVDKNGNIQLCDDSSLILKEAGELSTSVDKPRSHLFTYNDPEIKQVSGQIQKIVQDNKNVFNIFTGPKPKKGSYIVRVGLDELEGFKNARFEVKVNDVVCRQIEDMPRDPAYKYDNTRKWEFVTNVSETGARVMQFKADLKAVKEGYNRISIVNSQSEEQALTWLEVHID